MTPLLPAYFPVSIDLKKKIDVQIMTFLGQNFINLIKHRSNPPPPPSPKNGFHPQSSNRIYGRFQPFYLKFKQENHSGSTHALTQIVDM